MPDDNEKDNLKRVCSVKRSGGEIAGAVDERQEADVRGARHVYEVDNGRLPGTKYGGDWDLTMRNCQHSLKYKRSHLRLVPLVISGG